MDPLPTFLTFSLVISSIFTLICIQQVLITPILSKTDRSLLSIRILNGLFASTETVYIILCLNEYQNANKSTSETRFIFEMIRYLFLSICLLIFILDRLQYLYKTHINQLLPLWIRTIYITLCTIFNITSIITFSISLYSQSSFYWQIQLIHLKFDVVISCIIAIIAISHIYYKFNQKIQSYLNTILSQHNQLKQIENINNKLLDSSYMSQLTQGLPINSNIDTDHPLTKVDILANNLNLAAKIREANYKLFSYILLLCILGIIDFIYIPISIHRTANMTKMHSLTEPYILTSNIEYVFQRILFDIILIILIYWIYDNHSLFKILYNKKRRKHNDKLCIVTCVNCSLFIILFREIYLLIIYIMNRLCPCCISQNCLYFQQHIYDIKKYENYFGHLPKTKNNKFINIPNKNQWSDYEESLPSKQINSTTTMPICMAQPQKIRSQSHGIFESPPQLLNNYNKRRQSQVSVCGIPMAGDNNNNDNNNNDNNNSVHHRKQSTLLEYDTPIEIDEFGLSDSNSNSGLSYDLHVAQQIIDKEAENDDREYLSDAKSEQYDNFADIMIKREMEYLNNKSNDNNNNVENDKNKRESLEINNDNNNSRGSIANLGKKRRGSLILNAVDNIKAGIKNIKHKKEVKKEAQFMQTRREKNKLMNIDYENNTSNDDEKEYYNVKQDYNNHVDSHKKSMDRLSAVRNSLKSIIPSKFSKDRRKKNVNDNRDNYEPFEYATDTMIIHHDKQTPNLVVKQQFMSSSEDDDEDDNLSIATYGTAKDYLDEDFESELNALNISMNNPSVSPNRSIQSYQDHINDTHNIHRNNNDEKDNREESVSLSLESISNSSEDEESPPPPPRIVKHNKGNNSYHRRNRKNSIPLAQIQEIDANSTDMSENNKLCYNGPLTSGDDFSCDDMLTEAML